MTPEDFLEDHESQFEWPLPDGVPAALGLVPIAAFTGRGNHPLEVALGTVSHRPRADEVRRAWTARYGKAANPLLLVGAYQDDGGWKASICGPAGGDPPVESGLELGEVERIAAAALSEPSRHAAIRFLASIWSELETELPGLRNQGMFATHELRDGVPERGDWQEACVKGRDVLGYRGRELVERLGFSVETHATAASVLSIAGTKRAVAVFLDEGEEFEGSGDRFAGSSPVSHALALADRENLPWVVLTRGKQIRVYAARAETGVGRKGRSETFVEANLALLPDDRAGYVPLLFSAGALKDGGTFDEILEGSRDYSADLGARLRDRVYTDAVPSLAIALAQRYDGALDEDALRHVYEQALTVLFRLLFVAYAEDKDLLPYRSNGAYREHALKTLARELADRRSDGALVFDENSTDLWDDVAALWLAVDKGNVERGVPPYNGGLFSSEAEVNAAGATLAQVRLTNAEFGPALAAMLVDESTDGLVGPVDFRSLSVREFGTIYEGLLESSLSTAPSDLTLDKRNSYVPSGPGDEVVVRAGDVYFHDRSGARRASGSYFTKPFAVEHLLDHALEPALEEHIARLELLLDEGEDAKAAEAFFDFRCVDLAMGSGHFLVAAVDRIEAKLSAFLALRPIPHLTAEIDRLRKAAVAALGPLGEGVEIEQASLLRRQVARRCVYGVDLNPIAVELARLGLWIHTFVPGLPLSFLDHTLVRGNSLTGVGSLDEAIEALDPEYLPGQASLFRDEILSVLSRATESLERLARVSEASKAEIDEARAAQHDAEVAVGPVRDLFDLIVAMRVGRAQALHSFDETSISSHPDLSAAREVSSELAALHLPVAYPEVFLRESPGFDVLLGNPPWEEAMVDEPRFWARYRPGLMGLTVQQRTTEIGRLRSERPDLVAEFENERDGVAATRRLLAEAFPLGTGDVDFYKAFAWRDWRQLRENGRAGIVLPKTAFSAAGLEGWRRTVLSEGSMRNLTFLLNTGGWVFDDVEPRYTVALASLSRSKSEEVEIAGAFTSEADFVAHRASPARIKTVTLRSLTRAVSIPMVRDQTAADVLTKMSSGARIGDVFASSLRLVSEFHATNDRRFFDHSDPEEPVPVYSGASFNLWEPDTGSTFAVAERAVAEAELLKRLSRQQRLKKSAFYGVDFDRDLGGSLPFERVRLAFRGVVRATDTRTAIAALIPPETLLTNIAPYVLMNAGDERREAYVVGLFNSIPFDWYTRKFIETQMNFHFVYSFPLPERMDSELGRKVIEIAGRLSAVDARYDSWAQQVGVPVASVNSQDEKDDLIAELDACSAAIYELSESEVRYVFSSFHPGWSYGERLEQVLKHFRALQ